ncbi:MAG: hypothetical protein JWP87_5915 [Labilithrix sp.]|nr:hypothetical protein [Labilithrix sp.]
MDLLTQISGFFVAVAVTAIVVVRAATAPAPPPPRPATPNERAHFASAVASHEDDWSARAADDFPSDNWSQRDHFHGQEANTVRDLANNAGVSYEDVLRAVDDDLHRPLDPRSAARAPRRIVNAVPCQPRPIFE